jgi:hypothetical protein
MREEVMRAAPLREHVPAQSARLLRRAGSAEPVIARFTPQYLSSCGGFGEGNRWFVYREMQACFRYSFLL